MLLERLPSVALTRAGIWNSESPSHHTSADIAFAKHLASETLFPAVVAARGSEARLGALDSGSTDELQGGRCGLRLRTTETSHRLLVATVFGMQRSHVSGAGRGEGCVVLGGGARPRDPAPAGQGRGRRVRTHGDWTGRVRLASLADMGRAVLISLVYV